MLPPQFHRLIDVLQLLLAKHLFRKRHLKSQVDAAVDQLPEHHRTVFILREMEGKTYEEIAEITATNLGTVKSRLNRARNNFAQLIAPVLD